MDKKRGFTTKPLQHKKTNNITITGMLI